MHDKCRTLIDKLLYETKAGRTLILLLAGTFALPDQIETDPRITKFANYATPPLLAAGLFGPALATFIDAVMTVISADWALPPEQYRSHLNTIYKISGLAGLAFSCSAIYSIAVFRWAEHRLWVRIFQTLNHPTRRTSLRYFLLTTSFSAATTGGFLFVAALALPLAVGGNGWIVIDFFKTHPLLTFSMAGLVALSGLIKERINQLREQQIYGTAWARTLRSTVNAAALVGIILLITHIQ